MDSKPPKDDKSAELDELAKIWSGLIGHTSHLLTTKMATLRMKQKMLHEILPSLLKGYIAAVEHKLIDSDIKEKYLKNIHDLSNLEEQIAPMFEILDSTHDYCSQFNSDSRAICLMSAQHCIEQLMVTHPFEEGQHSLIHFEREHDFKFMCAPLFIETLLHELLIMALSSIGTMGKGFVKIWTYEQDNYGILNVQYSSSGTHDNSYFNNIFDRFLVERDGKIEIGMGLCRLAILQVGGKIICQSKENENIYFQLCFPKVE